MWLAFNSTFEVCGTVTPTKARITTIRRASPRCALCDRVKELRPYGPKGENVCFDCGMKDERACERAARGLLQMSIGDSWRHFVGFDMKKWQGRRRKEKV